MYCGQCGAAVSAGQKFCKSCGRPVEEFGAMPAPPLPPANHEPATNIYAGFWRRAFAMMADNVLLVVVGTAAALLLDPPQHLTRWSPLITALLFILFFILYYPIMEWSPLQATFGKWALRIKVTDQNGARLTLGRSFGRWISKWLSGITLGVGYAMAAFTARRQALHDKVARTLVLRRAVSPQATGFGRAPPVSALAAIFICLAVVLFGPGGIGIMAAIAIPAYQDYTVRAEVSSGLADAARYKAAVFEAHSEGADLSSISKQSLASYGLAPTSPYIGSVDVERGIVILEFGGRSNRLISRKTLLIVPSLLDDGSIVWICGRARPSDARLKPVIPLEQLSQYTTVPMKYLPAACRA